MKHTDFVDEFFVAVQRDSVERARELILKGADVNEVNGSSHKAIEYVRSAEMVKLLVDSGANVHSVGSYATDTPLHVAANESVVRALIQAGADVNAQNNKGITPLYFASEWGNLDTVNGLIKAGADVNLRDDYGLTPLHRSSLKGHVDVMKSLIKAGADVNAENEYGNTPLFDTRESRVLSVLIEAGADVKARNDEGKTVGEHFRRFNRAEMGDLADDFENQVVKHDKKLLDTNLPSAVQPGKKKAKAYI